MTILAYLLARFSEPSSYAGLGAVLAILGLHFSDTMTGQLAQFLAAGCALAALLLKERGLIKSLVVTLGLTAAMTLAACDDAADAIEIDAGCGTAETVARLAQDTVSAINAEISVADVEQRRAAR